MNVGILQLLGARTDSLKRRDLAPSPSKARMEPPRKMAAVRKEAGNTDNIDSVVDYRAFEVSRASSHSRRCVHAKVTNEHASKCVD